MSKQKTKRPYKWFITINNPAEHNCSHEEIKMNLLALNLIYACMKDEIGDKEKTYHTHLFIYLKNGVTFERVKKLFSTANIQEALGTPKQCRDYILKEGEHSDKAETTVPDTFEEIGELPIETKEKNTTMWLDIQEMIKSGCSDMEIYEKYPNSPLHSKAIQSIRKAYLRENSKGKRVKKKVFYYFGDTETGKSRSILDTYGDENVYIVTDYKHPFDSYIGEKIIVFDEFHSGIDIQAMLRYIDIYNCELPARYENTFANYDTIFIVSNIPLSEQFEYSDKKTFNAFIRRIDGVLQFSKKDVNAVFSFDNIELTEIDKNIYKR